LPKFILPPPKNKRQAGQQSAYRAYINAHPALRGYAQQIYKAALNYGLDPVYYASLIFFESGGKPGARSSANAYGLAQIHIPSWLGKTDPRTGKAITQADINNPTWNLNFGAYLFSKAVSQYGSYDAAYRKGYNPGYTGKGPFRDLPKGYVPTGTGKSPQESAQRSVETDVAKQDLTDPYVTIKNGKLVTTDAKHALHIFGKPLRRSELLQTWQNLNDIYLAYTGKPVTGRAVKDILASGKSRAKIIDILARGPNFVNSPIWRQNAPGYEAVWKSIYGQNSTPDPAAIRYGIVNSLDPGGFAQTLRDRPDYETSNEFRSNLASLSGVYTAIYGLPSDERSKNVLRNVTRQGWTSDQFAQYLRAQPEYQMSGEFKSRTLGLAGALGFLTGQVPTLGEDLKSSPTPAQAPTGKPAGVL
jgi:hypothetical protein